MSRVGVTHVQRHHERYHFRSGHLDQGRFKSFPVGDVPKPGATGTGPVGTMKMRNFEATGRPR